MPTVKCQVPDDVNASHTEPVYLIVGPQPWKRMCGACAAILQLPLPGK